MGLGTPLLAAKFVSDTLCGGPDPLLGSEAACRSWVHTHQLEAWDRSGVLRSADMIPAIGWFLNLVLVVTMRERYTNFARSVLCACAGRAGARSVMAVLLAAKHFGVAVPWVSGPSLTFFVTQGYFPATTLACSALYMAMVRPSLSTTIALDVLDFIPNVAITWFISHSEDLPHLRSPASMLALAAASAAVSTASILSARLQPGRRAQGALTGERAAAAGASPSKAATRKQSVGGAGGPKGDAAAAMRKQHAGAAAAPEADAIGAARTLAAAEVPGAAEVPAAAEVPGAAIGALAFGAAAAVPAAAAAAAAAALFEAPVGDALTAASTANSTGQLAATVGGSLIANDAAATGASAVTGALVAAGASAAAGTLISDATSAATGALAATGFSAEQLALLANYTSLYPKQVRVSIKIQDREPEDLLPAWRSLLMSALEGKGRVRSMAVRRGCVQLVFEVDEDGGGELVARLAQVASDGTLNARFDATSIAGGFEGQQLAVQLAARGGALSDNGAAFPAIFLDPGGHAAAPLSATVQLTSPPAGAVAAALQLPPRHKQAWAPPTPLPAVLSAWPSVSELPMAGLTAGHAVLSLSAAIPPGCAVIARHATAGYLPITVAGAAWRGGGACGGDSACSVGGACGGGSVTAATQACAPGCGVWELSVAFAAPPEPGRVVFEVVDEASGVLGLASSQLLLPSGAAAAELQRVVDSTTGVAAAPPHTSAYPRSPHFPHTPHPVLSDLGIWVDTFVLSHGDVHVGAGGAQATSIGGELLGFCELVGMRATHDMLTAMMERGGVVGLSGSAGMRADGGGAAPRLAVSDGDASGVAGAMAVPRSALAGGAMPAGPWLRHRRAPCGEAAAPVASATCAGGAAPAAAACAAPAAARPDADSLLHWSSIKAVLLHHLFLVLCLVRILPGFAPGYALLHAHQLILLAAAAARHCAALPHAAANALDAAERSVRPLFGAATLAINTGFLLAGAAGALRVHALVPALPPLWQTALVLSAEALFYGVVHPTERLSLLLPAALAYGLAGFCVCQSYGCAAAAAGAVGAPASAAPLAAYVINTCLRARGRAAGTFPKRRHRGSRCDAAAAAAFLSPLAKSR